MKQQSARMVALTAEVCRSWSTESTPAGVSIF